MGRYATFSMLVLLSVVPVSGTAQTDSAQRVTPGSSAGTGIRSVEGTGIQSVEGTGIRSVEGTGLRARSYTVKAGDTLGAIAQRHYGNAASWQVIFNANRASLRDPNLLKVGTTLKIPANN